MVKSVLKKNRKYSHFDLAPGTKQYMEAEEKRVTQKERDYNTVSDIKDEVYKTLMPVIQQTTDLFAQAKDNGRAI